MKRKNILITSFFAFVCVTNNYSQNIINITTIENGFIIDFTLPSYSVKDTNIYKVYNLNQIYSIIDIAQFGQISDVGYPNLPQYTFDLHLPSNASTFNVVESNKSTETINLSRKILPAQDYRETDSLSFMMQNDYYTSDGSLYSFEYQISDTFNIMGANGISFSIFPYQYNPSLDKIEVIKSCRFTITHNGSSSTALKKNILNNTVKDMYLNEIFENYPTLRSTSVNKGKYLIITAPKYESTLLYFANYKRNIGYDVTVANTSITGTTAGEIKNYIQAQYNNSDTRPSFILLVGDHEDIPASGGSTNGDEDNPLTDINYSRLSGNDYFADVFLGRFAVSKISELQNIIFKTIFMETNLHNLNKNAILLSGGGHGINQFDNPQRWVMDNVLNPQGFEHVFNFAIDGANRNDGLNALNNNYTLFIYRGHGAVNYLGEPFYLSGTDINNSTNTIYPFGFGFACNSNNFGYSLPSFGEYWIRSVHGGISYFGATTPTYRNTNNDIEKNVFNKMNDRSQLSPFINLGMKSYYKHCWYSLEYIRKRHIKAYNLLGDPSLYMNGIGCQENFTFTNTETFHRGDIITYSAEDKIITNENETSFVIEAGAKVNFIAGNSITLKPGFKTLAGSKFNATIGDCSSSLKSIKINDEKLSRDNQDEIMEYQRSTNQNVVTCYPNPAHENITFHIKCSDRVLHSISIFDLLGHKMIDIPLNNSTTGEWRTFTINTTNLLEGVYFYIINFKENYEKGKFIKL